MSSTTHKLSIAQLNASAIAIKIRALPGDSTPAQLYPQLYENGIAIMVGRDGKIERVVTDIELVDDHPVLLTSTLKNAPIDATVADIQQLFETQQQKWVPLLDEKGRYSGYCASRQELIKLWAGQFEMPRVGGLATPLGVYLTTGVHTTGAGAYGLVLTGISFAVFVMLARFGFQQLSTYYEPVRQVNDLVQMAIVFGMLLVILKLSPLSGLHAAEHQTIHVIEKGLPLTPENVISQPKSHHRCGTNMMVALIGLEMAYLGATSIEPFEYAFAFVMVWLVLLVVGWQYIGLAIQTVFTTSRPSAKQVDNAIQAGKSLIERYRMRPHGAPNIWQRVWGSGMLQIVMSFFITSWIFQQLIELWSHHA